MALRGPERRDQLDKADLPGPPESGPSASDLRTSNDRILEGCTLGPDFVEPNPHLPDNATFSGQAISNAHLPAPTDPNWWTVFGDPILTNFESRIADANLDVRRATIRIAQSRYQRGVTASAEFPGINGDAKYQRELYSKNGIISLIGPLLGPAGTSGINIQLIDEYTVGLDMSWELDLWDREWHCRCA
jgi:outer membrane protein TolC